jgi:hypothetical protein
MSVEDIDYLLENSETENFILYCDSALRDRDYFPYPNHYTLYFDQPFKYVTGIEILDASIPSTMYNIENDANSIAGFTYSLNKTITTTQSDYNTVLQSYLYELGNFPEFDTAFSKTTIAPTFVSSSENLSRITGQVVLSTFELVHTLFPSTDNLNPDKANDFMYDEVPSATDGPYWLFRRGVYTSAPVYIYGEASLNDAEFPLFLFTANNQEYAIINDPEDLQIQDIISKINTYRVIVNKNTDKTLDVIYYQVDNVQQSAILQLSNVNPNILYLMTMTFFNSTCIAGNYSAITFLEEAKRIMAGTNVAVAGSSTSDVSIQPKLKFTSSYPFVLNMDISTIRTSIGFDEYSEDNYSTYQKLHYKTNRRLFSSSYNSGSETWNLTAPGVLYLLGTRYCILKCPEIEDHLYASRSYSNFSPGIGMFKMYAVNDIAHQRFDFINFKKRPFHPIGKLDRLTLTFRRNDDTLYDFKGANHLILINIKYLVPTSKNRQFTRSVLNPNYTYDFNAYMVRHMEYKEPSDIDDDEENEEIDFKTKYAKQELEYDYSTSEEGSGGHTSDSEIDYRRVTRN